MLHSCTHVATVGVKGLTEQLKISWATFIIDKRLLCLKLGLLVFALVSNYCF